MRLFKICFFLLTLTSAFQLSAQEMNNQKLEQIIYLMSDTMTGVQGNWQFFVREVPMFCITDENNNRMRIVAPIKELKDVSKEEMVEAMEANFHSALDVKYAVSEGIMWTAYIHPLKELSKDQAMDAIQQVYNAAITYGTLYSSTDLVFPKSDKQLKEEEEEKKKKKLKRS